MTIGIGVYSPSQGYSFPRSYIDRLLFSGVLGTPMITGDTFFFPANITTLFDYVCVFQPGFIAWNSKSWRLETMLKEYYYQTPGGGVHNPVDFALTWLPPDATQGARILNVPFGVSTPPTTTLLASAPPSYWNPG